MQIVIRSIETIAEVRRVEALQREVWAMPDERDVVPAHVLVTAQKNGGLLLGAFDGETLAGFVFGFVGRTARGQFKHCSHMLGVLVPYRGQGIGELLKARQREFVIAQGLDLVTWTYDPLESANASLNIGRLGAVCNTYLRNVYGNLDDKLNTGLPTDRFQVDWWLHSSRVSARLEGGHLPPVHYTGDLPPDTGEFVNRVQVNASGYPEPGSWERRHGSRVLVEIPANFQRLKAHSVQLAGEWRSVTRAIFEAYFGDGYHVVDFLRVGDGDRRRCFYALDPISDRPWG